MTNWQSKPIGEAVKRITTGSTPLTSHPEFFGGQIPWFTPGDIGATRDLVESSRYITEEALSNGRAKLFEQKTLLVTCIGNIGRVGVLQVPASSNQQITALSFIDEVDVYYAYYWFTAHQHRLESQANQAVVPILNNARLKQIEFFYPPLPEQQRIAEVQFKADRLRRLRRTARELSDTYLQSVFLQMFGDPVTNPMGWEITKLGEVCSLIRDGVHKTPSYVPSGVPFITVRNIVTGRLDFQNTKFVSEEAHSDLTKRVKPARGDILVSKDGTIGVPCVVETDREFSIFVSVALLKPRRETIDSVFLAQQIRSDAVQRQIRESTKGIAIRHLHLGDFKRLTILLPSLANQQGFVRIMHKYKRLRAQQREAEHQAEHLFQTLLHRAFQGEL